MAHETSGALPQNDYATETVVSFGRIFLAILIDYLLFSTGLALALFVYGLIEYRAAHGAAAMEIQNFFGFWLELLIFASIELVIFFGLRMSPGRYALSIGSDYSVEQDILERESRLTILLSIVTIFSGLSQLTGWIVYTLPTPRFGFIPTDGPIMHIVLSCVVGVFWVVVGFLLFKAIRTGLILAVLGTLIEIASTVVSWEAWQGIAPMLILGTKVNLGGTASQAQMEFAEAHFPEILLFWSGLYLLLMLFAASKIMRQPGIHGV